MATKGRTAPAPVSAASDIASEQQDSTTGRLNAWRALVAAIETRIWIARNNAHARHQHHAQRAHWFMQGGYCFLIGALRLVARGMRP